MTGIVGAAFGTFLFDLFKIKNMAARGFAFGLASHGIGTARALTKDKKAGAFVALAMGLWYSNRYSFTFIVSFSDVF